ncbi:hypothetical protein [Atopobium sp. oral taxon 416]|uniref:hypothetical protein n=1 Tax=Atopobium sp. oral taxon 416 TaxID=712157 RepID=UPI001BAA7E5F|nr:hypothetical protein [Atopobium sp. oral taxon 416]QUC04760.1 hypothetical protein J4859_07590 [Atopobium sp. oral taxon 416]
MRKSIAKLVMPLAVAACIVTTLPACQAQTGSASNSNDSPSENSQATNQTDSNESQTKRVGKAGVGYVSVPSDWISLATKSGSGDVEFCDLSATQIITMKIMDSNDSDVRSSKAAENAAASNSSSNAPSTSDQNGQSSSNSNADSNSNSNNSSNSTQNSSSSSSDNNANQNNNGNASEESGPITVDDAVKAVIRHAKSLDVTDDNIIQESSKLINHPATQLTINYGDGTRVICWVLEDDNGVIRYVAAEAPSDTVNQVAQIVEDTYSF